MKQVIKVTAGRGWAGPVALVGLLLMPGAVATQSPRPELLPIPRSDLSTMEEPIRRGIVEFEGLVARLGRQPDIELDALGEAYGRLGELYHAHALRDAALPAYRNARRLAPNDPRWAYYLGFLHQDRGELVQAVEELESVLSLEPNDLPTLIRLGNVLLDLNQPEKAGMYLGRALALEDSSAAVLYGLGRVAAAEGNATSSIAHFEKSLVLQPEASVVHYPLGLAYRRAGEVDRARSHLERRGDRPVRFPDPRLDELAEIMTVSALQAVLALATHDDDFTARNYLGFTVSQLGETRGAIEYLGQALQQKEAEGRAPSELARIHYAIGGLHAHRKAEEEALASFRAAVKLDPTFADAHLKLANALARRREFAPALERYTRVLSLDPGSGEARIRRASVHLELGRESEAADDLRELIALQPENGRARLRLGALLARRGKDQAAAAQYREATELSLSDGEKALAHLNLAKLLERLTTGANREEALRHYELAVGYDAGLVEAQLRLAAAYGQSDRYAEASAVYGQVISAEPQNEAARLGQVSALVLAGRAEEALRQLEAGHLALPSSDTLTHLLARQLAISPKPELRDGSRAAQLVRSLLATRKAFLYGETLAMALAQSGSYKEAAVLQRSLVEQWRGRGLVGQVGDRLTANLERYEAGLTCCEQVGPGALLPPPVRDEGGTDP